MWTWTAVLPLLCIVSTTLGGGIIDDDSLLLRDGNWPTILSSLLDNQDSGSVMKRYLGQYQTQWHSNRVLGEVRPLPSALKSMIPLYHCRSDGFFAKTDSCRDYYQCKQLSEPGLFSVYLITCPYGFVFDNSLNTCNLASQVTAHPECVVNEATNNPTLRRQRPVHTESRMVKRSTPVNQIESDCSNEVVERMAIGSEETCVHIGNIENYVNLVMSLIPLQIYYENQEEFTQIFKNYDYDLGVAQEHAKIWRNGESIVLGIRQTFELAKEFEPEFNRKYTINKERVEVIKENEDQVRIINQTKDDIKTLEQELAEATETMGQVQIEAVMQFFRTIIASIETKLEEKRRVLREDFTLIQEMEELTKFLEFVRADSSKIRTVAVATRGKIETFRDNLNHDKSAFERHSRIANETFVKLQEETIKNNEALAEYKRKQDELEIKIEEERQESKALNAKINAAHKELRDMRRKLLDKISKTKTWKIIGAVLSPGIIGIGLLIYANQEEKKLSQLLQVTIANNKEEVDSLNSQIKTNYAEITFFQELMANSTSNSQELQNEMLDFITLDGDLKTLVSEVEKLISAINKAIAGVVVIKDVFDGVTQKLTEMIDLAKTAKTEAERLNAKYFIYNELSLLECNWRDIYVKVLNLDECTKNFQVLY